MKKYTFTFSILSLFAGLTLLLSLFLMGNFFLRGMKQAYEITEDKINESNKNITLTMTESLQSISTDLSILLTVASEKPVTENSDMLLKILWEQMMDGSHISSIFIADDNGSFLQARRSPKLAVRVIDYAEEKPQDIYYYKNTGYETVSEEAVAAEYDPRTRQWYETAGKKISWSDPYVFASTGRPGITLSVASYGENGKKTKVAAADFSLGSLSALLKEKAGGINGDIILFSKDADVIAASFDIAGMNDRKEIIKLKSLNNPVYSAAFDSVADGRLTGSEKGGGRTYEYFVEKLPSYIGKEWYIASFVKRSVIFNEIKATMLTTLLISIFIIGITYFPVLYILKKLFINPINRLKLMTDAVAGNRYESVEHIETVVSEFHSLSDSMVNMSVSIKGHEKAERDLIDSFIRIMAAAIDAKSRYTGEHCERVPQLAVMLAETIAEKGGGLADELNLRTESDWREFKIASWLHDCGKVTTPEYVVDKATKLETIYNRIHEIRTRFEVLYRDDIIEYYEKLSEHPEKRQELEAELIERRKQLYDDFDFIAKCNIGSEFMSDEDILRLNAIAQRTWTRYFCDRKGLSIAEEMRLKDVEQFPVPAEEKLLTDRKDHLIPRETGIDKDDYESFGFKVTVPEYAYNNGELYNLSVRRGTLTEEERYKINEHIIMTIKMLSGIKLPGELQRVPEYAGGHHETMTGKGYPRGLTSEEIPVAAKIIAVADIFEALTASDRPYKRAKTLSESLKIMEFMKKDGHIDKDVYEIFIRERVYMRYAEKFLSKSQIDET